MPLLKVAAVTAPLCLFVYGIFRLVDGMDGDHGPGLAWDLGHMFFLLAFVLLGVLIVNMRRIASGASRARRVVANAATVVGLAGVTAFLWVILGDLFSELKEHAPLPDLLYEAGPLLFQLGLITLLIQLATCRPRQLPIWSPFVVFFGFVPIAINLDLLPLGAVVILCGLAPLLRQSQQKSERSEHASTHSAPTPSVSQGS